MRDVELYRALLGLRAPWTAAGVDVDMAGQRVVVLWKPGPYPRPECGTPTAYDRQTPSMAPSGVDAVHVPATTLAHAFCSRDCGECNDGTPNFRSPSAIGPSTLC